jgi:hypothetical protein
MRSQWFLGLFEEAKVLSPAGRKSELRNPQEIQDSRAETTGLLAWCPGGGAPVFLNATPAKQSKNAETAAPTLARTGTRVKNRVYN